MQARYGFKYLVEVNRPMAAMSWAVMTVATEGVRRSDCALPVARLMLVLSP